MKHRLIISFLMITAGSVFAQRTLTDRVYHFAFDLSLGWTFTYFDSAKSFIRYECFNANSTARIDVYALKTDDTIDLNKFASFVVSEEILGKSLGKLQDSSRVLVNGLNAIKKTYVQRTRRRAKIDIQVWMLVKKNYGYVMLSRSLEGADQEALVRMAESFKVELPRSFFSWVIVLGFIGVCVYGLGLGLQRSAAWIRPLNWGALAYCSFVALVCAAALAVTYLAFQKVGVWPSLIAGAIVLLGIRKVPDAKPVIKAYEEVKRKNTAGAYRLFCQNHGSAPRYYKDARKRMRELMDEVVRKYKTMVAKQNTPIVRACLAMFEYIKRTDNFQVGVNYVGKNQIQDRTALYKARGWNVLPAGPAFIEQKNRRREEVITALIKFAFHKISPEDVLSFSRLNSPARDRINFEVTYIITASDMIYHWIEEKDWADDKKTRFTGVELKWLLEVKIPDHSETYKFSFESKPAEEFTARGKTTEKLYDAMAGSAFADFCRVFIEQSGLLPVVYQSLKQEKAVTVVEGKPPLPFKLDYLTIMQGLAEYAQSEEGVNVDELVHEYAGIVQQVTESISNMDFSFDFSFED